MPKFENDDFDLMSERDALLYLMKNLRSMDEMRQWVSRHDEEKGVSLDVRKVLFRQAWRRQEKPRTRD